MKLFIVAAAFIATAIAARYADAEAVKVAKPVVCRNYAIAKTGADHYDAVGICYDGRVAGKKPTLFYRFEEVSIVDATTGRMKVLVGWR